MTEEQEVTVCIAIYDHQHGEDMSVHRTIAGAEAHLREVAKENLEEWGEDTAQYGDDGQWYDNPFDLNKSVSVELSWY